MALSPRLSSVIAHPPFDAVVDPRKAFIIVDDFVSDTGVFGVSGDSMEGAQGVAVVAASGPALDADLWIPEDNDLNALGITFRVMLPTASSEFTLTFGDVEVLVDVGEEINVDDGTNDVDSDVVAAADVWYTIHLVVSANDVSINVNGSPNWFHIADPDHDTGAQELSTAGAADPNQALLDFIVVQQLTVRGGQFYDLQ